jgi:cell division protein ZapA (FtsZ GTPase activity inhibitor)
MSEQTTVKVVIRGQELSFKTDDPDHIKTLAAFVGRETEKFATSDASMPPAMAITLAAINIADELFKLRQEEADTSKRLGAMIKLADEAYGSADAADKDD